MTKIGLIDNQPAIVQAFDLNMTLYDNVNIKTFTTEKCVNELFIWLDNNPEMKFDVFIIDIILNGKTGLEVYEKLEDESRAKYYVFLTGCHEDDSRTVAAQEISKKDNVYFFRKPIAWRKILREHLKLF